MMQMQKMSASFSPRFHPTPSEWIRFLKSHMANLPLGFYEADLFTSSTALKEIPHLPRANDGRLYIITYCPDAQQHEIREVPGGLWVPSGEANKFDNHRGSAQLFSFYNKWGSTDWCMREYTLNDNDDEDFSSTFTVCVICERMMDEAKEPIIWGSDSDEGSSRSQEVESQQDEDTIRITADAYEESRDHRKYCKY